MVYTKFNGVRRPARSKLRSVFRLALILTIAYMTLLAAPAQAASPYDRWAEDFGIDINASYDGKRSMEMEGGTFESTERRAPGKMYMEVFMGGMSSGVILREDLKKSYILLPSMGFYKEDSLDDGMMQASNGMEFSSIKKVGSDVIIGYPSTKYQTKFKDNEGKGAGYIWVTNTGVPIKLDMIYSNKDVKGQRISMQFTELNMREQDPEYFELPANLKPMNMGNMATSMFKQGGAAPDTNTPATAPVPAATSDSDVARKQQACLEEASAKAAEAKKRTDKRRGFGRLINAVSRTANRFGLGDIQKATRDVYDANATVDDAEVVADELGITQDDIERCRNPS